MRRVVARLRLVGASAGAVAACGGVDDIGFDSAPDGGGAGGSGGNAATGAGGATGGGGGGGAGEDAGGRGDRDASQPPSCSVGADCGAAHDCVDRTCVAQRPCVNSLDCDGDRVCDPDLERCVQCISTADCDGERVCAGTLCREPCTSDRSCTPSGLLCDRSAGHCAECVGERDCPSSSACIDGRCVLDPCAAEGVGCPASPDAGANDAGIADAGIADAATDGTANGTGDEDAGPCIGLCPFVDTCPGADPTTVTGTVYMPNGEIPLHDALVYVPNATPPTVTEGASCARCGTDDLGPVLASTRSGPDGSFELRDVPAGVSFPVVIRAGKWRRIFSVSAMDACTTKEVTDPDQTRLPRNRSEGHIPKMAFSTGRVDALECLLYKAGVDASEFSRPDGDGRIHLYRADLAASSRGGAWPDEAAKQCSTCEDGDCQEEWCDGKTAGDHLSPIHADNLYGDRAVFESYDLVAFGCEGNETSRTLAHRDNLLHYVNEGGRLLLSHFHYDWIVRTGTGGYQTDFLHTTAVWYGGSGRGSLSNPTEAIVDGSFPRGAALIEWLAEVEAFPDRAPGDVLISEPRRFVQDVAGTSRRWIYTTDAFPYRHGEDAIQSFTFETPVGAAPSAACGRVAYVAFHITTGNHSSAAFPEHCTGELTGQEKILLFQLFDLAACL